MGRKNLKSGQRFFFFLSKFYITLLKLTVKQKRKLVNMRPYDLQARYKTQPGFFSAPIKFQLFRIIKKKGIGF